MFLFFSRPMSDLASLSVEEIFGLLEFNNPDVVSEIQRLFHENLSETREGLLVSGLIITQTLTLLMDSSCSSMLRWVEDILIIFIFTPALPPSGAS